MSNIKQVFGHFLYHGSPFGPTGTGPRPTDDLTPPTRDALFIYQLNNGGDFERLDETSLLKAKIVETKQYAKSVLSTCHSIGIISPATGHADTTKIDRTIVNKVAIISVPKQRELVNMLFFWEEETVRWRLLRKEEARLEKTLTGLPDDSDERIAIEEGLKVVHAKKRVPPSLRDDSGHGMEADLPGYERHER